MDGRPCRPSPPPLATATPPPPTRGSDEGKRGTGDGAAAQGTREGPCIRGLERRERVSGSPLPGPPSPRQAAHRGMRCRCASSARRGRAPGAVRFGSTSGPRELSAGGWTPFAVVGQPDTSARPAAAALCAGAAQRAQGAPSAGSLSGVCVRRRCRRAISAPTTAGRRRSIVAGASSLRLWGAFQARARPPPPPAPRALLARARRVGPRAWLPAQAQRGSERGVGHAGRSM